MNQKATTNLEKSLPQITKLAKFFSNGDQHVADDIVSEAVARLIEKGHENETPAFIMQAVQWVALGYMERSKTYTKYVGTIEDEAGYETEDGDEMDALELIADQTASPEDVVADMEFAAEFAAAIESLDEKSQVIISLLADGYSFAEIANELGVSRSAISQRMNNIQKALRAIL